MAHVGGQEYRLEGMRTGKDWNGLRTCNGAEDDGAESTRCERVKMKNSKDSVIEQESRPCKRRKILKTLSGVEHGIVFFGEEILASREAQVRSLFDGIPMHTNYH